MYLILGVVAVLVDHTYFGDLMTSRMRDDVTPGEPMRGLRAWAWRDAPPATSVRSDPPPVQLLCARPASPSGGRTAAPGDLK